MNKPAEKKREKLRNEYHILPHTVNKLAWCTEQAHKLKMSYGAFVSWLGI